MFFLFQETIIFCSQEKRCYLPSSIDDPPLLLGSLLFQLLLLFFLPGSIFLLLLIYGRLVLLLLLHGSLVLLLVVDQGSTPSRRRSFIVYSFCCFIFITGSISLTATASPLYFLIAPCLRPFIGAVVVAVVNI